MRRPEGRQHALTLRILRVEGRAWFGLEGVGRGVEVGEEEVTLFRRRGVFVLAIEQSVGKTTADSVRTIWSAGDEGKMDFRGLREGDIAPFYHVQKNLLLS